MAAASVLLVVASALVCTGFSAQISVDNHDAYDFLTSLTDGGHHRNAREIDYKNPPKCCGHDPMKLSKMDQEALDSCKAANKPKEARDAAFDKQLRGLSCWMECFGQNKSVLDPDGYVVKEELVGHYQNIYADASLHELSDKAINNCVPAANAKAKENGPEEMNGKKCNRALGYTMMCIRYMVESYCPKAEKIESTDCTKIRAYLKEWNKKTDLKFN